MNSLFLLQMRRKSERTRSTSSPPSTERTSTRRSSRRGKKTPSKSPEPVVKSSEEKVSETENDGDIEKARDSSSDRDSEERPSRRSRRSRSSKASSSEKSPSKRRRLGRSEKAPSPIMEENGENIEKPEEEEEEEEGRDAEKIEDIKNDENIEVKSSPTPSENDEDKNKKDSIDESADTKVESNENEKDGNESKNTVNVTQHIDEVRNDEEQSVSNLNEEDSQMEEGEIEKQRESSAEGESEKKESEEKSSSNGEINNDNNDNDSEEPEDSRESSRFKANKETVQESRWDVEVREEKPKERRSRFDQRHKDDTETKNHNEEGKENEKDCIVGNSKSSDGNIDEQKKVEKQSQPVRKRKWLSRKDSESKPKVLAISTDSLKNLISDVTPVPLSDIKLESSSEAEEICEVKDEMPSDREKIRNLEKRSREIEFKKDEKPLLSTNRKISILNEDNKTLQRPPSPPKNECSNILYITNLVRPFTILQLKGLLARTGKIVENGFWMDKIKSKCYVKYETEE